MKRSTFFNHPFLRILLVWFFCIGLWACTNKSSPQSNEDSAPSRLLVLSSFSILSNIIEEIGQEHVTVHNLVPTGTDPHEYSPRPNDMKFASRADLLIFHGLNLEGGDHGWLIKLADTAGNPKMQRVAASENVQPLYLTDEQGRKEVNPHAFVNPRVGIALTERIRDALIAADPTNADAYQASANAYLEKLQAIESKYAQTFAGMPADQRVLVTSEQAFQYLAQAYDLTEGYIWAIDTDKNGTPAQIKAAIAFVKQHKPARLFVESNVDRRPMETVSKATGVPIHPKPLFSDELGKKGQSADTYLGYLEYNLEQLEAMAE